MDYSIPSFDEKDLRIRLYSVLDEQLFLHGLSNYGGDVSQGRVRAALHDSVSTQTREKSCRNTTRYSNNIQGRSFAVHTSLTLPREISPL